MPVNTADVAISDIIKEEIKYKMGFKDARGNLYNLAELMAECENGILEEKEMDRIKVDIMKADGDACRGILEIVGGNKEEELKCPMTKMFYVNPMKNTICGHTVDEQSLEQLRKAKKVNCAYPGCSNKNKGVDLKYFVEDEDMRLKIESWKRRKEKETAKRRKEEEEEEEAL
ncbi:hypothetical protein TrRE_jg4287 [Triparma retinervis]|uniref:SP-RING-type domain-containing protein n=1 Tax=Triparma retinervis TaxID=2557542 RepID=A0A9W7AHX2_9STRA|nr:hypothetical protein TrRE_jg4287 [Triparma retinervis]